LRIVSRKVPEATPTSAASSVIDIAMTRCRIKLVVRYKVKRG